MKPLDPASLRRYCALAAAVGALPLAAGTAYLVALVAAARPGRAAATTTGPVHRSARFLVVIPAHDEEALLPGTLAGLAAVDYPPDRVEVVVVADNCRDRTAEVATTGGARVLVRTDPVRRGKGHALAWALERLSEEMSRRDAILFLDADCRPSPNLLTAMEARLRDGAVAVQADYVVANPEGSWSAALRWAAFALLHRIRPLGREGLGLSCGIFGTGFAMRPALLARHPWRSHGLSEDLDYHLGLVAAGERVRYVPEACVWSSMPTSLRASREQNLRWEGGRRELIRRWTPALVRAGVRRRDRSLLLAGLEPVVPPQSLFAVGNVGLLLAAASLRSRVMVVLAGLNACGQAAYVLGGLWLTRPPAAVWRALALSPGLILWKAGLQLRVLAGRGPATWIATRAQSR